MVIKLTDKLKQQPRRLIFSLILSLFWVIFLWNFWDKDVYVLGLNAFVFLGLLLVFFNTILAEKKLLTKSNLTWLIPLVLIISSFAVYDNLFIKPFNILVLPVLATIFINYSFLKDHQKKYWDLSFFFTLLFRIFAPFTRLKKSAQAHNQIIKLHQGPASVLKKVILGLAIFILLAMLVIIPLLSSADPEFAQKLGEAYQWLAEILSTTLLVKILFFYVLSVFLYAIFLAWQKPIDIKDKERTDKKMDSIISGIVVGGILLLYLLFLWLQLERLWVSGLPTDFKGVEVLVKSGFWQLIFLSMINIIILFFTYKKTNKFVQGILIFFTLASLLLLFSAGYRMLLYVIFYGLSYEKFFASYTVLYCAILFVYLIIKIAAQSRLNIIKFILFLFLWMYGVINIMPVEQIILRSNIELAKNEYSRINLYESRILSPDVLSYIEKNNSHDFMKVNHRDDQAVDWSQWIEQNKNIIRNKKWYELNLNNIFYKL
ncbi:MAG: hypothetical protein COV55_00400 [Candidatus Komeilibacteria bacterium CG11_big_fil_rev_8_21_14_0_20_36_20]|uniref:Uncharacterized protein n=1 Tax=Candidatus Komeilibacteria bacterium CG11_big_fil_rev_8_21_14_0_20_36_20 TaxID=1974477 RepID=A0A2H0NE72_9BACT|nr:MAG: hypothetical protein COV55_00400 [Candidatus Komeilibacteria bacterium CG11_big_fil_rev_8_21_14_0_20_36_20]PIR81641.1 MAG: hypothetical protein COU21_02245 [Candidatus Komeilibacteria bacterium CG10_big_fil_rev_8_21_14_0_10_36_65]PJC55739.1 MAG: hypothetical protein CO027_00410 [Candidatus Komeilibacteria bacterium CG_4_9_14_0_2_um_filter_36_13]